METIKTWFNNIRHWIVVISTLALAILWYLFIRRGEKIRDLQREAVLNKLGTQIGKALDKVHEDNKEFEDAIKEYDRLRESYDRMFPDPKE